MKLVVRASVLMLLSLCSSVTVAAEQVVLLLSTLDNPFFIAMKQGAERKAVELGVELQVLNSNDDPAQERQHIDSIIAAKANVVLFNPTDSYLSAQSVQRLNAAAIPLITLDRHVERATVASHIASDNVSGGMLAGNFIAKALGAKTVVAQIEGNADTSATIERGEGFALAVRTNQFLLKASQQGDFDRHGGYLATQKMLLENPSIEAIFAHNDEMALGAIEASRQLGRAPLIVGFDGSKAALQAVKQGGLAATIAQRPKMIGSMGVASAVRLLQGKLVALHQPVPLQLISQ